MVKWFKMLLTILLSKRMTKIWGEFSIKWLRSQNLQELKLDLELLERVLI